MITDVAGAENKMPLLISLLGSLQRDLAVLHHLVLTVDSTDDTNRLCWKGLGHHLNGISKQKTLPRIYNGK